MKELRAKLLQHIIQTRFEASFGKKWWENTLLPHMRDEAAKLDSRCGQKYAMALKKYGRSISIGDLDTTVLSTIILYDQHFQFGNAAVSFSDYERNITKKLHSLRNKLNHEENDMDASREVERQTIRLIRNSVDELNLMETNPELAYDIIAGYAEEFGGEYDKNTEKFMDVSARYEAAMDMVRWKPDEAATALAALAEEGFPSAGKSLLELYTKSTNLFDLNKATSLIHQYPDVLDNGLKQKLESLQSVIPHIIWGTPDMCESFADELRSGKLIRNAQILEYIKAIRSEFPNGLLYFLPDDLGTIRMLLSADNPNTAQATRLAAKIYQDDNVTGRFVLTLLQLAREAEFNAERTIKAVKKCAATGYLPVLEFYAARRFAADAIISSDDPFVSLLSLGAEKGSAKCAELLKNVRGNVSAPVEDILLQFNDLTHMSEIEQLKKDNAMLQKRLKIAYAVSAAAIIASIIISLMKV